MEETDFMLSTAFKKAVGKSNTDPRLSATEEVARSNPAVNLSDVWIDANLIPGSAPTLLDQWGVFSVEQGNLILPLVQKIERLRLTVKPGTGSTLSHALLRDALPHDFGEGYQYILVDGNNQPVPFGLNGWNLDPESGTLAFFRGLPENYDSTFYLTFWRYCGRKGSTGLLKTDGSTEFLPGYTPKTPRAPVSREYVDYELSKVGAIVDKLTPPVPPSFKGRALSTVKPLLPLRFLLTNELTAVAFYSDEFSVQVPEFHNDGEGTVSLIVNGVELDSFTLFLDMQPGVYGVKSGLFLVEKNQDPYRNDLAASGFYKTIAMKIPLSYAVLRDFIPAQEPFANITLRFSKPGQAFVSETLRIGFEPDISTGSAQRFYLDNFVGDGWISGVPAIVSGDTIKAHLSIATLQHFKGPLVGALNLPELGVYSASIWSRDTYTILRQIQDYSLDIKVVPGMYSETLSYRGEAYDVTQEVNGASSFQYNLRVDSISDESKRVTSGFGANPVDGYGLPYDSKQDLHDNQELQLIGGKYKLPAGNYGLNGVIPAGHFVSIGLPAGPSYNDIPESMRYATFPFMILPPFNGATITLSGLEGIELDELSGELIGGISLQVKVVESATGWLDANVAYDGVSLPRSSGTGCLVVANSTKSSRRITFGKKPVYGLVLVRVGLSKKGTSFSGVSFDALF